MCSAIEPNTDRLRSKNASLLDRVAVRSFAKLTVGTLILFAVGQVVCIARVSSMPERVNKLSVYRYGTAMTPMRYSGRETRG